MMLCEFSEKRKSLEIRGSVLGFKWLGENEKVIDIDSVQMTV